MSANLEGLEQPSPENRQQSPTEARQARFVAACNARSSDYVSPIDMNRLGPTGADEALIRDPKNFAPKHFKWDLQDDGTATITLSNPSSLNSLTFDSYAELRDTFAGLRHCLSAVKRVVITGGMTDKGRQFSSGGDVNSIIEPLTRMDQYDLRVFAAMTAEMILNIRLAPQMFIAKVEGICAGAGTALMLACDYRLGLDGSKWNKNGELDPENGKIPGSNIGTMFTKVGLTINDMGVPALLSRIVGEARSFEIISRAQWIDGTVAMVLGIYSEAFKTPEELQIGVDNLVRELSKLPELELAISKHNMNRQSGMSIIERIIDDGDVQAASMGRPAMTAYCRNFLAGQRGGDITDGYQGLIGRYDQSQDPNIY